MVFRILFCHSQFKRDKNQKGVKCLGSAGFTARTRSQQTGPTGSWIWVKLSLFHCPPSPKHVYLSLTGVGGLDCKKAGFDRAADGAAEPRALWEKKTVSGL